MTLQIVLRKLLLGDDAEKELREEKGIPAANEKAAYVAQRAGLCSCRRTDGVLCARPALGHKKCFPCWSNDRDKRPCDHLPRGVE